MEMRGCPVLSLGDGLFGGGRRVDPTTMVLFAAVKDALLSGPAAEVLRRSLGADEIQRASVLHPEERMPS